MPYLSETFFQPRLALFQMVGWTHHSWFIFFLSLNPSCFHLLLKPGKQPPAPPQRPPTCLNYACWVAAIGIRFSLAVTYITSVAQGINVIHPAIPAKTPSTPCQDSPAWANRDRQTLVARNLSPNLLSPHITQQSSNVSQSPRLPSAVQWQLPVHSHCETQRQRGMPLPSNSSARGAGVEARKARHRWHYARDWRISAPLTKCCLP